jgi:hypothetical protein
MFAELERTRGALNWISMQTLPAQTEAGAIAPTHALIKRDRPAAPVL